MLRGGRVARGACCKEQVRFEIGNGGNYMELRLQQQQAEDLTCSRCAAHSMQHSRRLPRSLPKP